MPLPQFDAAEIGKARNYKISTAFSVLYCCLYSVTIRVPIDRGPCNFAFFHTRGADGLLFGISQRF